MANKKLYKFVESNLTDCPILDYNRLYVYAFVQDMNDRDFVRQPNGNVTSRRCHWVYARKEANMPEGALAVVYFTTNNARIGYLYDASFALPIKIDMDAFMNDANERLGKLVKLGYLEKLFNDTVLCLDTHTDRCGWSYEDVDAQGTTSPSREAVTEAKLLGIKYGMTCEWEPCEKGLGGFYFRTVLGG